MNENETYSNLWDAEKTVVGEEKFSSTLLGSLG